MKPVLLLSPLAALLALPVSAALLGTVLFAAGMVALLASDYSRRPALTTAAGARHCGARCETLRLAA